MHISQAKRTGKGGGGVLGQIVEQSLLSRANYTRLQLQRHMKSPTAEEAVTLQLALILPLTFCTNILDLCQRRVHKNSQVLIKNAILKRGLKTVSLYAIPSRMI